MGLGAMSRSAAVLLLLLWVCTASTKVTQGKSRPMRLFAGHAAAAPAPLNPAGASETTSTLQAPSAPLEREDPSVWPTARLTTIAEAIDAGQFASAPVQKRNGVVLGQKMGFQRVQVNGVALWVPVSEVADYVMDNWQEV